MVDPGDVGEHGVAHLRVLFSLLSSLLFFFIIIIIIVVVVYCYDYYFIISLRLVVLSLL